jgi:ABC transport system ATP-binding/permease protein
VLSRRPVPRNLVNLKDTGKGYASRTVLRDVTLGVSSGERIGVVGRNGDGKSTLLRLVAGEEEPDAGAVTRERGLAVALLGQRDELDPARLVRDSLAGDWTRDARPREVVSGLLGGVALDAPVSALSGGERRRVALAGLLLDPPELLLLDEPTNHLDVEGVDWLARHLAARRGALMVVTHDRWFLDAVCTSTWEVADGAVHQYDGGYAAYVLARAERERVAAVREERRQGLLRKELAWLQRGPPARTSKPRFRIEAANALIEGEPEPRDRAELLRFAAARLGDRVLDAEDVSVAFKGRGAASEPGPTGRSGEASRVAHPSGATGRSGEAAGSAPPSGATGRSGEASRVAPPSGATGRSGEAGGSAPRTILRRVTWRLGPGDRVAVVGVNGSGKTTLVRLLAGSLEPDSGTVERGATVRLAFLSQDTAAIAGHLNVLESLEDVKTASASAAPRRARWSATCRAASGGGCS